MMMMMMGRDGSRDRIRMGWGVSVDRDGILKKPS